jgi:hypothetical protein
MSLTKTSFGKNHLSARPRKNLLPFRLASQSDSTGYPENKLGRTKVNAPSSGADSGRHFSSAVESITSFGVPISSGGPSRHIDIQKTASMKPHSVFLRKGCLLPGGIDLRQEQFCEKWMSVEDTTTSALDVKIRNAGWHFMWLQDAYSHFATGRTAESAISKAIKLTLHQVKGRFNAAELYSINVRKYPGLPGCQGYALCPPDPARGLARAC